MRTFSLVLVLGCIVTAPAADLESRALTHYVPQDLLDIRICRLSGTRFYGRLFLIRVPLLLKE